jgi:type III pantothenate kinase
MKLLVDIGNTSIKWALQGDGCTVGESQLRNGKAFKDLARPIWKNLEVPERVIIASVAGNEFDKAVQTWIKRRWKVMAEFLRASAAQCGVINAYTQPERLGADRWACLIAAHAQHVNPVVIVDCGTAITIDALQQSGRHVGGLIIPGMELMRTSLVARAHGIEMLASDNQEIALLGRSTEVGISGGVLYAAVSLVDRVFSDIRAELGASTRLVVTGGDAGRIQPLLSSRSVLEPDMVLKGLAVYAGETSTRHTSVDPAAKQEVQEAVV